MANQPIVPAISPKPVQTVPGQAIVPATSPPTSFIPKEYNLVLAMRYCKEECGDQFPGLWELVILDPKTLKDAKVLEKMDDYGRMKAQVIVDATSKGDVAGKIQRLVKNYQLPPRVVPEPKKA